MVQDQKTGAKAVEYGLATAKMIAAILGAEKTGNPRSNEYILKGKCVVIKCARQTTDSVGVSYQMVERVDAILGSFETGSGVYEIYELLPEVYKTNMRPTRSKGASAGRVGIVKKSTFYDEGKRLKVVQI